MLLALQDLGMIAATGHNICCPAAGILFNIL
jgi:hypothetical protein